MKRIITIVMVVILSMLVACGGGTSTPPTTAPSTQMVGTEVKIDGGSYWVITPAQLYGFKTKDFLLVNADTPGPVMIIQGTDIYVKPEEINQSLNKFPADKSGKIVVYCMAGVRSVEVATALVKAGYTRVMDLEGGIIKWQQQGYPAVPYTKTGT
jgi:rhodanese-related sulfurtransferase